MHIMNTAVRAIAHQTDRLEASAARLARLGATTRRGETPPDIAKEAVVRIEAGAATEASIAVIRSEDERLGHLLDILA
jgi:hypothetical protein